jgi:hypothetical protein
MNDAPRPRGGEGVEQQTEALLEHRLGQGVALQQEADSADRPAPRLASPEAALGLAGEPIARVLRRAHQAAEAMDGPDEVRAVLYVAHCFADELAAANPRFDRQGFVTAVSGEPVGVRSTAGSASGSRAERLLAAADSRQMTDATPPRVTQTAFRDDAHRSH